MIFKSMLIAIWLLFPFISQAQKNHVNLKKIDEATKQSVLASFKKQNTDWSNSKIYLYYYSPYIKTARRNLPSTKTKTNLTNIELAEKFLRLNTKSFGIDLKYVSQLLKTSRNINSSSEVRFFSKSLIQYSGYPKRENFGYEIDIYFKIKNHQIYQITNRTNKYEFEEITSTPSVSAFNSVILNNLIGKKLSYFSIAGEEIDAGNVALIDIEPKGLSIELLFLDQNLGPRLGLTWRYSITKGLLKWEAYYSAIDGQFLVLLRNFAS